MTQHLTPKGNLRPSVPNEAQRDGDPLDLWPSEVVLDHMTDAALLADADAVICYVNPAFERLTGFTAPEVIGQSLEVALPCAAAGIWPVVRGGTPWHGEVQCVRNDGVAFDAEVAIAPVCDAAGAPLLFVCTQRDVTRYNALQRLKTRFVTEASDELRASITHLKVFVGLLQRGRPEKRDQYMEALQGSVAQLETLVERLFSVSQLDLQDLALLERRALDLNSMISQMAARYSAVAADARIVLAQDLDHTLPQIEANMELVIQAVTNLLTNALDYTPPGGRVTLRTGVMRHNGGLYAAAIVDDTGQGVMPDEQAEVFEPFYRGQASQALGVPGTGLGLTIVRQIARLHGGDVLVRSDGVPGKGSTFTLLFPLASQREAHS
ncbi:MAG: PAS domain-containing sensor histidine kinase [Anaerolineae bacterium]|nr:PAS domain-containing sensor histidine kinase [Anaerolineae bacterium]